MRCNPLRTQCDKKLQVSCMTFLDARYQAPLAKHPQRVVLGRTASWGLTAGDGTPSQAMALSTSASPATGSGRRLGVSPAPKAAPPSRAPAAPGPPCRAAQEH